MAATPKKPVTLPFDNNFIASWGVDHIKQFDGGRQANLLLNKQHGAGFESKGAYLFGHFSMQIKLVQGDSAGTVTAFYLSSQTAEHDEIDFEFLGNKSGKPYILQTNVFTGGKGFREHRIYLWFDPTKDYHSYSVLWNKYQIVFFVDEIPIRVFKNCQDLGLGYPLNQPMKVHSSLWNGDKWATRGGLEKTDWTKAPFIASFREFHVDACEVSSPQSACATQAWQWWNQEDFRDLDWRQWGQLKWVRKDYTIYNYCTDAQRNNKMPPECVHDRYN
eukprot:PITA_04748